MKEDIRFRELYSNQKKAVEKAKTIIHTHGGVLLNAEIGFGKSQPVDSKVITPYGEVEIGSLKIGDYVIGSDGMPTQVTGVFVQGKLPTYKVTFTDGASTECSIEHLWRVEHLYKTKRPNWQTLTLREIIGKGIRHHNKGYQFKIPLASSVEYTPASKLPLDPYLLGLLLGDGCFTGSMVNLTMATGDLEELTPIIRESLPSSLKLGHKYGESVSSVSFSSTLPHKGSIQSNYLKIVLKDLELLNRYSGQKFIPTIYKYQSSNNRLELLRGLMDTDGSCSGNRTVFHTTSKQLAGDVKWLIQSLGGTCRLWENDRTQKDGRGVEYGVSVRMFECPFKLNRKAVNWKPCSKKNQYYRKFREVEEVGMREHVCISVSAEDSLYLTDNFIVTHNTSVALKIAEELGYTNILYITEPRLIKGIEHHSLMNVVTLPYSQLKLPKNSLLAVEKKASELTKGIDDSYFIIADEIHNVGKISSQRSRVFMELRRRLRNNPLIAMSGTLKPTYNEQVVPFLYYIPNKYLHLELKDLYKAIKTDCDYYSPKILIPRINRFAKQTTDAHTEQLINLLDDITVKESKVRAGEITLYETIITCPTPSSDFISKMRELKRKRGADLPNNEFIKYHSSQFQRAADGYILKQPLLGERSVLRFKRNPKLEAVKSLLKIKEGEKVIILCAFRDCAEIVATELNALHYGGDLSKTKAEELITTFKTSSEHNVLVSTLSALSTGFNLDEADTIIYYSLFLNYKDISQSFGRIDRATSTRDKHYYFLQVDWSWEKEKLATARYKLETIAKEFGFYQTKVVNQYHSTCLTSTPN